jgi:phage/plasmid-like protein (TIGR03299 family)
MSDLNETLARANRDLAADAPIIEVERDVVVGADPSENVAGRTVRQQVTNHQVTTQDRLGLYREKGWHGLGDVIGDELTGRQATERFVGWRVDQKDVYTRINDQERALPLKANVRSDNNELLGVVSSDYVLIQNTDIGDFADALLAESVDAGVRCRMETCGSLLGGRKVFLTMRPDRDIRVGATGQDVTVPLLTILNGHDGTLAMTACWSFVRVVCNNTYTSALGGADQDVGSGRAFRIRHRGKVTDYLQEARACLGLAVKGLERFQLAANQMVSTRLDQARLRDFFDDAYAAQYGPCPEATGEVVEIYQARRRLVIDAWLSILGEDANLIDGVAGTLWAAFNAITQWQDHVRVGQGRVRATDRQQHVKLLGVASVDKRKAFKVAMATAR